ncbi:MAG: hypothetical protein J6T20_07685 [Treponema sp.]|nr:hypothetical protein [Treponema sp.]
MEPKVGTMDSAVLAVGKNGPREYTLKKEVTLKILAATASTQKQLSALTAALFSS